ncbi:MAG: DUF4190 domain-containing protein [Acidimicrobiales bacterium]
MQEDQSANPTTTADGTEAPPPAGKNALARTSLVLGLCGIVAFVGFGIVPVLAIVFGLLALRRIRRSGGALPGRKEAVAGIALGAAETVVFAVMVVTGSLSLTASVGDSSVLDAKYRGNGIAFTYPSTWEESDTVTVDRKARGGGKLFQTVIGRADHDLIVIQAFRLERPVTEVSADEVQGELEDLVAGLLGDDGEVLSGPTPVEVGALAGYSFTFSLRTAEKVDLRSKMTFLFDGSTEYTINCQHNRYAGQVAKACAQVLDTFHTT